MEFVSYVLPQEGGGGIHQTSQILYHKPVLLDGLPLVLPR